MGPEEIEKKIISEALLQEKINFERDSPGKKKILRGFAEEKIFIRKGFPGKNKLISEISSAPRLLMVVPLTQGCIL